MSLQPAQNKAITADHVTNNLLNACSEFPVRAIKKGQIILYQGEAPRNAFVIKEGVVKIYNLSSQGDEKIITFAVKGDVLPPAWLFNRTSVALYYYDSFTDCELYSVPREDIFHILNSNPDAMQEMLERFVTQYVGATLHINALEQSKSTDKIIRTLQQLVMRFGEEQGPGLWRINLRLTHQDLANMIGLTRETVAMELESKKAGVEKLLADQQAMQAQLDAQRAEAANLLAMNQGQQASFESTITQNNSKISELRRQQAVENAKHFVGGWQSGGSGGYPWANAPFPNTIADPWGMYLRQCVSYTAWRVSASGRHMPYWGGRGNANQWDDNARAAGIPVDGAPRPGDVAVSNAGTYGHVMYVEGVNGDNTITISQYNAGWDGKYSVGRRSTAGLVFIHFP